MKKHLFGSLAILIMAGLVLGASFSPETSATVPGTNYLVSKSSSGAWPDGSSNPIGLHSISGNGRYVVFSSSASNLISNDANGNTADVFVKDTQTGAVKLVDIDSSGNQAPHGGMYSSISYDGRYVVFVSNDDLVTGTTGANIYLRDLVNNTTAVVSVDATGTAMIGSYPDVNADGRYITFVTHESSPFGGYVNAVVIKDMLSGAFQNIALGHWDSTYPSIDCDGHVVAFLSNDDLGVAPSGYNQLYNYYNYFYSTVDWSSNPKSLVTTDSTISGFKIPPQVSCDGNQITTTGTAVYNRLTKVFTSTDQVDNSGHIAKIASISGDGRYIAFLSKGTDIDSSHGSTGRDSNYDVFVRDTKTGITQLVSFTTAGYLSGRVFTPSPYGGVSLSSDGSTVAYTYASPDASHTSWELLSGIDTSVRDIYTSKTGF